MLNFAFLEMDLGKVSLSRFVYVSKKKNVSYILLTEKISIVWLPINLIYRYCALRVLRLFVSQAVTS